MRLQRLKGLLVTALVHVVGALSVDIPSVPVVNLGYAQYQGRYNATTNIAEYIGLRFAAPPTGIWRWMPPQAPAPVHGIQLATEHPPRCIAAKAPPAAERNIYRDVVKRAPTQQSEDCLFLSVYYPGRTPPKDPLPVIVWIHGGAYVLGSSEGFNGGNIVETSGHDVVVVTIQYRLGIFGFLSSGKIKTSGAPNAGLLDQQFALRWVQKHIGKFGGDPSKVTIWGESAGGGSVLMHLIANDGKTSPPLFRAAIAGSPCLLPQYQFNHPIVESVYDSVVAQAGCASSGNTLTCLRSADVQLLDAANSNISAGSFIGTYIALPVVDGSFIKQRPSVAFKQGNVNKAKLLTFTNANETQRESIPENMDAAYWALNTFPLFSNAEAITAAKIYAGLGSPARQVSIMVSEITFQCPVLSTLTAFPDAYKGVFAVPPALHGMDLAFYFKDSSMFRFFQRPEYNNPVFANAFTRAFTNFAKTLDPNPTPGTPDAALVPRWESYANNRMEMVFNMTEEGRPNIKAEKINGMLVNRCAFWNDRRILELTAQ
ncbi:hypothetical protein HGRIS_008931 [Hohenbuehelia grisea]|uniref:Carboxylic ester hydrolase n=1 Tax=Hohenbuehelia grisea TaxID=104357 RepID=A0ABR3IZR7_9AGAR